MSTEIGAEKRRLSRSSSENEEVVTEIVTNEDINSKEESEITKHLDKQQHKEKLADEKDQKEDGRKTLGGTTTRGKEDTAATPTLIKNNVIPGDGSRQIIAVSANKNPTAFFQLARKFLMTNEMCDLSALEGAIVSAVDAAHLLERSKLASIVKIHTSYVNVEPKRRRQGSQQKGGICSAIIPEGASSSTTLADKLHLSKAESSSITNSSVIGTSNSTEELSDPLPMLESSPSKKSTKVGGIQQEVQQAMTLNPSSSLSGSGIRELRRARILVTVKRTESYKRWLEDNPTQRQAIIAGTANVTAEDIVGGECSSSKKNNRTDLTTTTKDASTPSLSKIED